jgi:hypothetical protein
MPLASADGVTSGAIEQEKKPSPGSSPGLIAPKPLPIKMHGLHASVPQGGDVKGEFRSFDLFCESQLTLASSFCSPNI